MKYITFFLTLCALSFASEKGITPAAGPLPNHNADVIIDAELLVWYSNVTNLSYAIKGKNVLFGNQLVPGQTIFAPTKKEQFDLEWDPGLRIGVGVVTPHDGWDFYGNWTYFYNSYSDTSSVAVFDNSDFSQTASGNPVGTEALRSPWFLNPNGEFFQKIRARWAVLFNQIDLELGRKFWISCYLSLRPFVGLRTYWSRMHFSVNGSRPLRTDSDFLQARSLYKQKSWGVGLLTGLDTAWEFVRNWSFYARGAFALPYGKVWIRRNASEFSFNQAGVVVENIEATTEEAVYKTQTFLDLALGIRWDKAFENFRLLFDAGWESHFLVDYNKIFRGTETSIAFTDLPSTNGDLTFSGVVVRGRIEF